MLIYDKAYTEIKNKYLLPITNYSVPYSKLMKNNVKEILVAKPVAITIPQDNVYIFKFDEKILFEGLLGDIELFYIRHVLQKKDVMISGVHNFSANWNIVTCYYNAFFAASLLLRLCHRGNIFLDSKLKNDTEKIISIFTDNAIKLDSNQFYEVIEDEGQFCLKLSKVSEGTHEIVWKKMDALIDELKMLTRKKSDEELILTSIKEMNNKLSNTFPSKLRNRVNYQPLYGVKYIDKKLYSINCNASWVEKIINFEDTVDDSQIAVYMYAYTQYIEHFCENLIAEYYIIRGRGNGFLSKIKQNIGEEIISIAPQFKY